MTEHDRLLHEEVARAESRARTPWLEPADLAEATGDYSAIGKRPMRHLNAVDYDGLHAVPILAWIGAMLAMGFFFSWIGSL
jgi:hypothetical protein